MSKNSNYSRSAFIRRGRNEFCFGAEPKPPVEGGKVSRYNVKCWWEGYEEAEQQREKDIRERLEAEEDGSEG